jgi:outer membrane protein assembly factor BamB
VNNSPILWSTVSDGADGLVATEDVVIVIGNEVISAFDLRTGELRWESGMSDTSGPTAAAITSDGLVVVAPPFEAIQAFDLSSGEPRPAPDEVIVLEADDGRLPEGYEFDAAGLRYAGATIWSEKTEAAPFVKRLGDLTIINNFDHGLRVVDDYGRVLAAPTLGPREYDEVPILVSGNFAMTVAVDGVLYVVSEQR